MFIATAQKNGARFLPFHEVIGVDPARGQVTVRNRALGDELVIGCDAIINAAGPWAPHITQMADVSLELEASAGVMVTLRERLCNMVINLLACLLVMETLLSLNAIPVSWVQLHGQLMTLRIFRFLRNISISCWNWQSG